MNKGSRDIIFEKEDVRGAIYLARKISEKYKEDKAVSIQKVTGTIQDDLDKESRDLSDSAIRRIIQFPENRVPLTYGTMNKVLKAYQPNYANFVDYVADHHIEIHEEVEYDDDELKTIILEIRRNHAKRKGKTLKEDSTKDIRDNKKSTFVSVLKTHYTERKEF